MDPGMNGGYGPNGNAGMNGTSVNGQWQADVIIGVDFGMTCTGEHTCFLHRT